MTVETQHSTYKELLPKWTKINLVDGGEDSVHAAGELLLPKLEQQNVDQYKAYRERTRFLNAFNRTLLGLEGTVTRRETIIKDNGIEDLTDDITTTGISLKDYGEEALQNQLKYGFSGTLVDYVSTDPELTVAEVEALNARPNFGYYPALTIINWKYNTIKNKHILVMVVLKETVSEWVNDFETEEVVQYRVLRLEEVNEDGEVENNEYFYSQQLYTKGKGTEYLPGEKIYPLMDNQKQTRIPFFFHGKPVKPPLYDLCTTNIKHYQLKADHNHALHYIGLPTPVFSGSSAKDPDAPTTIGPERIIHLENPQAKGQFMELEGKGLEHIEKELEACKTDMAYLGANMLAPESMVQETATKATIRRSSETSALSKIVTDLNRTLTESLQYLSLWYGVEDVSEISFKMSTDFDPSRLSSQDLLALVQSWQSGAYSKQTLFENLQKGEIIDGTKQFEDEEELIETEGTGNNMPPEGYEEGEES